MPVETDEELGEILDLRTICVVGCSTTPGKAAHEIPKYLKENGYEIVPVNPYADSVLGEKAVDSLAEIDREIDVVDVFRPSEELAGIVDAMLDREDTPVLWTQLGIRDEAAMERAENAGHRTVVDRCMKVEHGRLR